MVFAFISPWHVFVLDLYGKQPAYMREWVGCEKNIFEFVWWIVCHIKNQSKLIFLLIMWGHPQGAIDWVTGVLICYALFCPNFVVVCRKCLKYIWKSQFLLWCQLCHGSSNLPNYNLKQSKTLVPDID